MITLRASAWFEQSAQSCLSLPIQGAISPLDEDLVRVLEAVSSPVVGALADRRYQRPQRADGEAL